ncbi:MAG: type I-E CRISPR-associated protein Cas6/Cse3/CasE [Chloroflexota bacterium]
MYLSQLILDPRARRVQSEIANPYELHRTLLKAFPDQEQGGPGRVLYRLEPPVRGRGPELILLVQSDQEPDWSKLDQPPGYRLPNGQGNPKVFNPAFSPGQRLYFRLRANPTKRLLHDDPERKLKKGQRIGLLKEEDQLHWLQRKAQEGGFSVLGVTIAAEGKQQGKIRHPDEQPHDLTYLAVRFEGLLQVTDPGRFLNTLRQGLGSGKGLGFGLLSLART